MLVLDIYSEIHHSLKIAQKQALYRTSILGKVSQHDPKPSIERRLSAKIIIYVARSAAAEISRVPVYAKPLVLDFMKQFLRDDNAKFMTESHTIPTQIPPAWIKSTQLSMHSSTEEVLRPPESSPAAKFTLQNTLNVYDLEVDATVVVCVVPFIAGQSRERAVVGYAV